VLKWAKERLAEPMTEITREKVLQIIEAARKKGEKPDLNEA